MLRQISLRTNMYTDFSRSHYIIDARINSTQLIIIICFEICLILFETRFETLFYPDILLR